MKIAHLSDLHVLDLAGVPPHRYLNKRLTGYANIRFKRGHIHRPDLVRQCFRKIREEEFDHVVITGDLTNLALETEFRAVRQMLDQELAFSADRVSVVPGNHDVYTRGAMRSGRFAQFFGGETASDLPIGVDLGVGIFPYVRLRGPVAIIGVSSAVPRLPFVAAGELGKKQLTILRDLLEHPEVRDRTRVWLFHHPANDAMASSKRWVEGLRDLHDLPTGIGEKDILLHGHLHRRIKRNAAGGSITIGATSASLEHEDQDKMAGYNRYTFTSNGRLASMDACVANEDGSAFHTRAIPEL